MMPVLLFLVAGAACTPASPTEAVGQRLRFCRRWRIGVPSLEIARLHPVLSEKYETLRADSSGWYQFLTMS